MSQLIHRLFVALAIGYVGLAIIGGVRFYSAVPWWDAWDGYLNFFMLVSDGNWYAWWAQHNEHRIVLSRLFFWLDFVFFQGNGAFLIVINYLLVTAEFIVLYLCLKERLASEFTDNTATRFTRQVLALLMLAVSFSWMHRVNLVWGFQSQFFLAQLLPLIAFYLLHQSQQNTSRSTLLFAFACLSGIASLGSMANGILALPLMVLLAVILRLAWPRILILLVLAVLGVCIYFYHYKFPAVRGTPMMALLTTPLDFLQYILLFLGSPFYHLTKDFGFAVVITQMAALFLVSSSLFFAVQSLRTPRVSSLQLSLLTFILYVGISAVAAAGSRVHSAGVDQALTARYTTSTLMVWLSLLILYAPAIHKKIAVARSLLLWCLLFILLLFLPLQVKALRSIADRNANFNLAALALTLGIEDTSSIHLIYPDVKHVSTIAAKAADKKLSIFAHAPFNEARQLLGQMEQNRTPARCSGELQGLTAIADDARYYQVRGWLEANHPSQAPETIRLLDQEGKVVGFALSGFTPTHSGQTNPLNTKHPGFVGYLMAEQINKNIILKGKNPDCELLVLASLVTDPSLSR